MFLTFRPTLIITAPAAILWEKEWIRKKDKDGIHENECVCVNDCKGGETYGQEKVSWRIKTFWKDWRCVEYSDDKWSRPNVKK